MKMKKKIILVATTAVIVIAMTGMAFAANNGNGSVSGSINLTASVLAKCGAITGNDITVTIDPSGPSASASGGLTTIACTNNLTNVLVTACGLGQSDGTKAGSCTAGSGPVNGYLVTGTSGDPAINYHLAFTGSFTGGGFSNPTTLVNGNTAFTLVSGAGDALYGSNNYSDTIAITVNY